MLQMNLRLNGFLSPPFDSSSTKKKKVMCFNESVHSLRNLSASEIKGKITPFSLSQKSTVF